VVAEPTFAELFAACRSSAVHLEMRDSYTPTATTYQAWKKGYRADPTDRKTWWRPFLDQVVNAVERGVVVKRVRIIGEPVSEYTRFLYETTFTNIEAGEDIRWLPRGDASRLRLPGNDFWLFDNELVQFNHFDGNGNPVAKENVKEPDVVEFCAAAFEAAWKLATPHDEYHAI
jgi:hypothetical protein